MSQLIFPKNPTPPQIINLLNEVRLAIGMVRDFSEAKFLVNKADAVKYLAKKAESTEDIQRQAAATALRARRRAGELLAEMAERGERATKAGGGPKAESHAATQLHHLGVSKSDSSRWQKMATVPDDEFEAFVNKAPELTNQGVLRLAKEAEREQKRKVNRQRIATVPALNIAVPEPAPTLVLDPPWDWGDEGDIDQFGRATPTYSTIPFEDLLNLPVEKVTRPDAHLYLWITNRSLPKGFELLEAWNFRYITCLTWVKPSFGMGNYFRGQTEQILFGVRGSLSLLRRDIGTVITAPRGPLHSSKPEAFYELVEQCSPGPWIEGFSRANRPGWITWGEEGSTP